MRTEEEVRMRALNLAELVEMEEEKKSGLLNAYSAAVRNRQEASVVEECRHQYSLSVTRYTALRQTLNTLEWVLELREI